MSQGIGEAAQLLDVTKVLDGQIRTMREQMEMGVEAMSLGITAEVLSHEIANIVDQLSIRTGEINAYLTRKSLTDSKILRFVEHVSTTTNGLRRQLGHLAPSLKYARTRRTQVDLREFTDDLAEYHRSRWLEIPIKIVVDEQQSMRVKINRGKLTQVVDNLVLNSDYWLREDIRAGRIDAGIITLRINSPNLVVSDNGQGIHPSVEASLFEPFVSLKKDGRGLGLYVAQQLLDSEGCSIRLRPRRNSNHRLYQFEIDLSDCLIEGDD